MQSTTGIPIIASERQAAGFVLSDPGQGRIFQLDDDRRKRSLFRDRQSITDGRKPKLLDVVPVQNSESGLLLSACQRGSNTVFADHEVAVPKVIKVTTERLYSEGLLLWSWSVSHGQSTRSLA